MRFNRACGGWMESAAPVKRLGNRLAGRLSQRRQGFVGLHNSARADCRPARGVLSFFNKNR
jgi:hypothetical protein